MLLQRFPVLLGFSAFVIADFLLQTPVPIGFNSTQLTVAPCDGFDPTNQDAGITEWPIAGSVINIATSETDVIWEFNAALLTDVTNFVPLTPQLSQQGLGQFCEPQIPGIAAWNGEDAVLQIVQHAPEGLIYLVRSRKLPTYRIPLTTAIDNVLCSNFNI